MNTNISIDVRVYPIDEPKGSTLAFASVFIGDIAAIRSIRVVQGKERIFVSMPKTKDKNGNYHDLAYPVVSELRKDINAAVLAEWEKQSALAPDERGYETYNYDIENLRKPGEIGYSFTLHIIPDPKSNTLAFATALLDEIVAINSIRVFKSDKGLFVSMPQSKDKESNYHDVSYPLSGDVRKALCSDIIVDYQQKATEADD